jgi:transglutaminase-like putative cysteine protease
MRGAGTSPAGRAGQPPVATLAAVIALIVTACLPLTRVYVGLGWMRSVLSAALLAIGIAWVCRQLGLGSAAAFGISVVGWFGFVAVTFLSDTLAGGLVPTAHTLRAAIALWVRGTELVRLRPSPAAAEPGLLLLSVTGVWAVAYTVEGMVFRLAAPVQAVIITFILWATPLTISRPGGYAWGLAAAFLAAAAWLLLTCGRADVTGWGVWVDPSGFDADSGRRPSWALRGASLAMTVTAITAGVVFARLLPGATEPPWLQLQSLTGATLASNPILDIKARLVSPDTRPVFRVYSPRPVYLRITSLDVYDGQREQWTSAGIRGMRVSGPLRNEGPTTISEKVSVNITVGSVGPGAVLVPAPYLPVSVSGPASKSFQYDPRVATLTLNRDVTLSPGDQYEVTAGIPAPPGEVADTVESRRGGDGTQLPNGIPPQVGQLAQQISRQAGAVTPFEQALAIQDELRTWTYSLKPAPGHGAQAMVSFLATREGYCEQFAGTMAVMLRTLGIPARVAVGFTPGAPIGNSEYVVTNANAHAWVEARFDHVGWIAFEPTPRSDGNVLIPHATNLAPSLLQSQHQDDATPNDSLQADQVGRQDRLPGQGLSPDRPRDDPARSGAQPQAQPGVQPQPPKAPHPFSRVPLRILLPALTVLALGVVAGVVRHRRTRAASPTDRALRARARVERLGRGFGIHPLATETDREYLDRLSTAVEARKGGVAASPAKAHQGISPFQPRGRPAEPAAERLARATAAACYASTVTDAVADAAEGAAKDLRHQLLDSLPIYRRLLARTRGVVSTMLRPLLERAADVMRFPHH